MPGVLQRKSAGASYEIGEKRKRTIRETGCVEKIINGTEKVRENHT